VNIVSKKACRIAIPLVVFNEALPVILVFPVMEFCKTSILFTKQSQTSTAFLHPSLLVSCIFGNTATK